MFSLLLARRERKRGSREKVVLALRVGGETGVALLLDFWDCELLFSDILCRDIEICTEGPTKLIVT